MDKYLVDFENVKAEGLKNLDKYNPGDSIIFFYSENCKNISLDIINEIMGRNLQLSFFKIKTGYKNALDFQLSSYLGFLIGQGDPKDNYYIVSDDKGFDIICNFWNMQSYSVQRQGITVTPATKKKKTKEPGKTNGIYVATIDEIRNVLSEEDDPESVLLIFNQFKTKQAIINGISKKFKDSKKAGEVYKKLKPLLKDKKKS